ncbi:MAG: FdhF/YdeP family oxidoreductase [Cyclobacteriaceae bacterium]
MKRPEQTELTPEELTGLKKTAPKTNSVGATAIVSSLNQMAKYMPPLDAIKASLKMNQKGGFDCPGCAWPDPDDERSALGEYCENGFKAIAEEISKKTIDRSFFAKHSIEEMGTWTDFELGKKGRLTEPMVLREGATHYEPISWNDAFNLIGKELNRLKSPDEASFYTSGRTSNEAAFLYQLFVREYGTNNLPDCSNMCHESSGEGLIKTVGIGKGSVTLADIYEAEVVMVIGQNPGTNHPRMLSALEKCKENGGLIVSVNPLPEAGLIKFTNPQSPLKMLKGGTSLTDIFLQVKINGDVALLKAIMVMLLALEKEQPGKVFDLKFIQKNTLGYDALIQDLEKQNLAELIKDSGLTETQIREVANLLASKKKIIICWAMGLTQHKNGVANIQEVVNLLLLKGSIGKPGAGTCPVRGHSNVQGDRTMGVWELPPKYLLDNIKKTFYFDPPRHDGFSVVDAIQAMHEKKASVFIAMGGNFLSATPDTSYTAEALRKCSLTAHVSTKLNRSHLVHGKTALILPCLSRSDKDLQESGEQFVTVENSMGVVHSSEGVLTPCSNHLLSEPAIVAGIAKGTIKDSKVDWDEMISNYDTIRDAIEKVIPGFDDFNKRVREPGGFYLPNGARKQEFNTESGKAEFTVNAVPKNSLKNSEYMMMTIRSHDQYNTTIYGLDDRYRGIYNERRIVLINKEDLSTSGFKEGDLVTLVGMFTGVKRVAEKFILVEYDIPKGCLATYFPEANTLVPINSYADKSKTPTSKLVVVKLEEYKETI